MKITNIFLFIIFSINILKLNANCLDISGPNIGFVGNSLAFTVSSSYCDKCVDCNVTSFKLFVPTGGSATDQFGNTYNAGSHTIQDNLLYNGSITLTFSNTGDYQLSYIWGGPNGNCPVGDQCPPGSTNSKIIRISLPPSGGGSSTGCDFYNFFGDSKSNIIHALDYNPATNEYFAVGLQDNNKMLLVKLSGDGNLIWSKQVSGGYSARSIHRISNTEYFVTTDSSNTSNPNHDANVHLFKINGSNGNIIWSKRFGSSKRDRNSFILPSNSGTFFLIYSESVNSSIEDLVVLKIDGNGNILPGSNNKKKFDFSGDAQFYDFISDGNNGFIAVGGFHSGGRHSIMVHYDQNINVSTTLYDGSNSFNEEFYKVIKTIDGGFVIAGEHTASTINAKRDVSIRKFNSSFSKLWEKTITVNINSSLWNAGVQGLTEDGNGNIYLSLFNPDEPNDYKSKLLKFSSSGNLIFTKRFEEISSLNLSKIQISGSNALAAFVSLNLNTGGFGSNDIFISRMDNVDDFCKTQSTNNPGINSFTYTYSVRPPIITTAQLVDYNISALSENLILNTGKICTTNTQQACNINANFTFSGTLNTGSPISFTNTSTDPDYNIVYFQWNFGDGNFASTANSTHTFNTAGTYNVTFFVQNDNPCIRCNDLITIPITITDPYIPPPCESCIGTFAPTGGKKYVISAWAMEKISSGTGLPYSYSKPKISLIFTNSSSSTTVAGPFYPKGPIIDGWQLIENEFNIPNDAVNVQLKLESDLGDVYFDDIRLFPFDASFKSYVYDPVNLRFVAELDERNFGTFYEYNEEGQLVRIKKETEKGIMTIQESNTFIKKP